MERFQIVAKVNLVMIKKCETYFYIFIFKNSNSVNKFKINTKLVITKNVKKSDLKKIKEINLI